MFNQSKFFLFLDLRAALLSLLIHVHIDNKPRTERIVPSYTKKLSFVSEKKTLDKTFTESLKIKEDYFDKKDKTKNKKEMKFQNVVSEITTINSFTKTIKDKVRKSRLKISFFIKN